MLTWQWVNTHATKLSTQWAGRFWYSFYERGADMREFAIVAVAYIARRAPETLRKLPESKITDILLLELQHRPWLLVLDGLERILTAYHRSDAAQARDNTVEDNIVINGGKPTDCIRPKDDDLLRRLVKAGEGSD